MTHRKPVAYRSPVFRIRALLPLCFPVLTVAPPDLRPATAPPDLRLPPLPRQICDHRRCPARSPAAARPARPLAARAASFARRVGSKPGQAPQAPRRPPIGRGLRLSAAALALPPPTGTAARPRRPRGGPLTCWCCWWPHGCFGRRRARPPARLGGLTSFGAVPRSPPVPSGPSGTLHTSGAFVADVRSGASPRCPPWPCRRPPWPGPAGPAAASGRAYTGAARQFRMQFPLDMLPVRITSC